MKQQQVEQTGLLFKIRKTDYISGYYSKLKGIDLLGDANWEPFLPIGEMQNKPFIFDTLSCATFSGLNSVETQIKYFVEKNLIPTEYVEYLKDIGFDLLKEEFNGSDCFTAIMSGTTKQGNYLQSIWDSFRKDGILPQNYLPFNKDWNNFDSWINPLNITDSMKERAKKILEVFSFGYEWVITGDESSTEKTDIAKEQLKQAPLHSACNSKPHAVMIYKKGYYFDSYDPYIGKKVSSIQFSLKGIVTINDVDKIYTTIKKGSKGLDVKKLQRKLSLKDDGIFGSKTQSSVIAFQKKNKLTADGIVGPLTRSCLNNI